MDEQENVYENIRYILGRLWDNAMSVKNDRNNAVNPESRNFLDGVLQGYSEVFSTIENEIKNEEIDRERIGFDFDFNELQ